MEEWEFLKNNVYYADGSLRDIYVRNTTKEDWILWAEVVNKNYKTSYFSGETGLTTDKIDIYDVFEYWDGVRDTISDGTVFLGDIIVKTYFGSPDEIENDITPTEINALEDHLMLIDYLETISKILNKRVVLTPENYSPSYEFELIVVDEGKVVIHGL